MTLYPDAQPTWYDAESAAVARAGGRAITEQVAHFVERWQRGQYAHSALVDGHLKVITTPQAAMANDPAECWRMHIDYSGGHGAEGWRWRAEREARVGQHAEPDPQDPALRVVLLRDAEAMLDWPIYRTALAAEVFDALWGQASPGEEKMLSTLAHCAGLPNTREGRK